MMKYSVMLNNDSQKKKYLSNMTNVNELIVFE